MNDMTLSEIAKLKRNTEADIASIIQDFMTTTGVPVGAIKLELYTTNPFSGQPGCPTLIEVSLDVNLNKGLAMRYCVEAKR